MKIYYFLSGIENGKTFIVNPFIETYVDRNNFQGQIISSNNYKAKYNINDYINLKLYKIISSKKLYDITYFLHENILNLDNLEIITLECHFYDKLNNNLLSICNDNKLYTLTFSNSKDINNNNYIFCPTLVITTI